MFFLPQEAKQTREERLLEVKRIVVDIETDSLDATTIHCVVIKEDSKVYAYTHANMSDCVKHIEAADIIVMHNGVSFDAPVLKRLLNVNIPLSKIRDTLITVSYTHLTLPTKRIV